MRLISLFFSISLSFQPAFGYGNSSSAPKSVPKTGSKQAFQDLSLCISRLRTGGGYTHPEAVVACLQFTQNNNSNVLVKDNNVAGGMTRQKCMALLKGVPFRGGASAGRYCAKYSELENTEVIDQYYDASDYESEI